MLSYIPKKHAYQILGQLDRFPGGAKSSMLKIPPLIYIGITASPETGPTPSHDLNDLNLSWAKMGEFKFVNELLNMFCLFKFVRKMERIQYT